MKTATAIAKGLILGVILISIAALVGCSTKPFPPGPDPLFSPGGTEPTPDELHRQNIRFITGNPVHP